MFVETLPNQKNIDITFWEAPNLWVRCRRRFFFSRKMAPIFLEAPNLWVGGLIKNELLVGPLEFTKFHMQGAHDEWDIRVFI